MVVMIEKTFNPDFPIILGLYGLACSGKTSVASTLVPDAIVTENRGPIRWDTLNFAAPLYEMVSVRHQIEGDYRKDRTLYAIHEILVDLYSGSPLYGAPRYDDLVQLVHEVYTTPLSESGTKPRDFMQTIGMRCREFDPDCFVKRLKRKVMAGASLVEDDQIYAMVVDDVRLPNEAEMIANFPNGVVIELTASPEVRRERALARDGFAMTPEQANHVSETSTIHSDLIAGTIDTNNLTIDEVTGHATFILHQALRGLFDAQVV